MLSTKSNACVKICFINKRYSSIDLVLQIIISSFNLSISLIVISSFTFFRYRSLNNIIAFLKLTKAVIASSIFVMLISLYDLATCSMLNHTHLFHQSALSYLCRALLLKLGRIRQSANKKNLNNLI